MVTVAAEHGAAGGLGAQLVADALSVPFLDRARTEYLRRVFGMNADDRALYHLIVDTVALGIDASVELVLAASRARTRPVRNES